MIGTHLHHPECHGAPVAIEWLPTIVLVAALVAVYLALAARRKRLLGRPWSSPRTLAWVGGSILLASAVSPWVAEPAHSDARSHMLQHLLLGMYAPLGLVMAAPVTLLLGASSTRGRRRIALILGSPAIRFLFHPMVAGATNIGGIYVLYLTGLYAASMSSTLLHIVVNVHFVLAGSLFAWAIAGPDPAPHRPGMRLRVVALVLAAAAHAYLAKTLYARANALPPGNHHTAAEIERAAQWMYYGGDLAELALAIALFATWYRARGRCRHSRQPRRDFHCSCTFARF